MPCETYGNSDEEDEFGNTIDDLTRLLCSACRIIKKYNVKDIPKTLSEYMSDHEKSDQERRAKEKKEREVEKLRREARAKLSKDEKIALGVDDDDD